MLSLHRTWPQRARAALTPAVLAAVCLAGGCTSSEPGEASDNPGGLVRATAARTRAPVDVARAGRDPGELVRAAQVPHRRVAEALGAHRFRSTTAVTVREGETAMQELTVETAIDIDAGGAFHAVSENSMDYGREVYFKDGYLYLAPRYSKFHRRRPNTPDEPAAIRDAMYAELGAHLELIAGSIQVEDGGEVSHGSREARAVAIRKAAQPRRAQAAQAPQRAWRRDAVVEAAEGEIVLDGDTGVPLAATLRGTLAFERDGRSFTMSFTVDHAIEDTGEDGGQAPDIEVPGADRLVATPLRSREVADRDTLLEGIAPPARKARPPQGAGGNP